MTDPFKPYRGRFESYARLPAAGRDRDEILQELATISAEENKIWQGGQISGTFYHAGEAHRRFLNEVCGLFTHVNVLQIDICPSMSKLEAEIVAMTAGMLNADVVNEDDTADEVCGTVTSGGSESIMMAMKVYRDRARVEKNVTAPEIVMTHTAHPAFDKAGEYFGIKMVHAPTPPPDFRVDVEAVKGLINENTIALVGSAGNYPYGLIDPLEELSALALEHDIGFHVDGCLGGFILPWVEKLGYDVPRFDFRLPGLTSMSADTHKFGYGLKGTSVVLYRNKALRKYQFFQVPDWPGGVYASPSMTGSRSGGLLAAAWASLVSLGEAGYLKAAKALMDVATRIKDGLAEIPEFELIGQPTFVLSFKSDDVDVYHVNDFMQDKGWRFNVLQLPPALHFCVTMPQTLVPDMPDKLIADLKEAVVYARQEQADGTIARTSAIYGLSGSEEGRAQLSEFIAGMFDMLYTV